MHMNGIWHSTGSFTIDIDSKDIITISHIGYRDVEYIYDDIPNIINLFKNFKSNIDVSNSVKKEKII